MMVMKGVFPINHALNVPKLLNMARNCDCALLIKSILLFGLLQQLHEQWMIEIYHWHHNSLLLLSLAHLNRQTPLWNISYHLFLPMMMKMRQVQMKVP